ncbi:MAG: PAS domain S-box protein [Candidatus Eisenbacteria bacterium]|nr:PAS domain S-box protein [Candidatus Eisenbacteria bacterium]MBU1948854.1 PAS domain S-box protein [Candidatus Eisenbacteria bacterium]
MNTEIGERQRVKKALLESESKYRGVFEQAGDAVVLIDCETTNFYEFNDRAPEILGYNREEFSRFGLQDVDAMEFPEETVRPVEESVQAGHESFMAKMKKKDGGICDTMISAKTISLRDHLYIISIWRDVTEERRVAAVLLESAERLWGIMESMSDAVMVANSHGSLVYANREAEKILGSEYMHSSHWSNEYGVFKRDKMTKIPNEDLNLSRALAGLSTDNVEQFIRNPRVPEGFTVLSSGRPMYDKDGNVIGAVLVLKNITQHKILQTQQLQSQKMEALGKLAGGIAHDFNNLLHIILGFTELAKEMNEKKASCSGALVQIFKATMRAKGFVSQILAFSRQKERERKPIMIAPILDEVIQFLRVRSLLQ